MDIFSRYKVVIENTDTPTVLEIGAAEGEDTVRYLEALVALKRPFRYVAFEPDERNVWHIQRVKDRYPMLEIVPHAVGDRNGMVPWRASNHPFSGSVKEPVEHHAMYPHIKFSDPTLIYMERLDVIAMRLGLDRIDWVWCDVQGAEDLVIEGGRETFRKTRFFYTEYIEVQAYAGQIGRDEIHRRLPGTWRIAEDYRSWDKGGDCLFENLTARG
jgi:FkbM family methyltransferase